METIKTILVEDEEPAMKLLQRYLKKDSRFDIVGSAYDGESAVSMITNFRPDVVFLDIQLPDMSGFDVLRLLEKPLSPLVIFVTAFDQYAVKAFEVHAIDYLLKPVESKRFEKTLSRISKLLASDNNQELSNNIQKAIDFVDTGTYVHKIPVKKLNNVRMLPVNEISHIVSEHRLVQIYTRKLDKYWTNETLEQLFNRLNPKDFFRIHRSSILNLNVDFEVENWSDGRLRLHLPNDIKLFVSRNIAPNFKHKFLSDC